ncbi:hypothetical protein DM01DRAFT_1378374 [Hesseltinella vesiculosa]|uniref:Uncharacterized protein n=1 Tax=Hesseltinella vesiculosa TaxID=101127 RepID=A0A1X2G265_9FUNG|nr:hypothetical protein DM01DRAFT_1379064 [Hesseltinella vesiculosa]ORX44563.1 hypothetical protein DM01DRAFT_1378374 [Hesseltinella vesiculosa]
MAGVVVSNVAGSSMASSSWIFLAIGPPSVNRVAGSTRMIQSGISVVIESLLANPTTSTITQVFAALAFA